MTDTCIGLISGTSMDGIDAIVVNIGDSSMRVLESFSFLYPADLQERLRIAAKTPLNRKIEGLATLDQETAECFRDAATALLRQANIDAAAITVIGSHGQTLRHEPNIDEPYSLQIGDASIIASGTGIPTVGDFRNADIAAGGQGAPLVPPFHAWLFGDHNETRVVVNIGGMANLTIIPASSGVTGFDTGPGNTLMDSWMQLHSATAFDAGGKLAASGVVDEGLLQRLLADPYFDAMPPKSTGFEYFNIGWLQRAGVEDLAVPDVMATLCELTAITIANDIASHSPRADGVFVCGGGVHNVHLMGRLQAHLSGIDVLTTAVAGLDPDWVEAAAFAWLGLRTLRGLPGNLPSVTGASRSVVLGAIHQP